MKIFHVKYYYFFIILEIFLLTVLGVGTVIRSFAEEKFLAGQYRLIHYDCNGTQQRLGMI